MDELLKARDKIHDTFTANPSPKRTSSGDSKTAKPVKDGSEEGVLEDLLPTDSKDKDKDKDKDRSKSSKKKWLNPFAKGDGKVP